LIGLLNAAALLLLAAGVLKVIRPGNGASTLATARIPGAARIPGRLFNRAAGLAEVAIAGTAVAVGGRPAAILITVGFGTLAALSIRMLRLATGSARPDCGCFGAARPLTHWHTAVNLGYAGIGVVSIVRPPAALGEQLFRQPGTGVPLLLSALVLSYLSYLMMTALPDLLRVAVRLEVS